MKYFIVIVGVLALLAVGYAQSDDGEATTVSPSEDDADSSDEQPSPPVPPSRPSVNPFGRPSLPSRPSGLRPPPVPTIRRPGQQQNGLTFGASQGPFGGQRPGTNGFNFGIFQG